VVAGCGVGGMHNAMRIKKSTINIIGRKPSLMKLNETTFIGG
jgi:hypothetical protein